MYKSLLVTAALVLVPLPALSQGRYEDRDSSSDRSYRDVEGLLRELGDEVRGGIRGTFGRGAAFLLRSGDSTVAVRCDARESMRACLDATMTLLDKARAAAPSGGAAPPQR